MKVDAFSFELPESAIASAPAEKRDAARLLAVLPDGTLEDHQVTDIASLLCEGDLLILNNTKVIPARLRGKRGQARVECLLHKQLSGHEWMSFVKPAKRVRVGEVIEFAEDFHAEVIEKQEGGQVHLAFNHSGADFFAQLAQYGEVPLPPYIKREEGATKQDLTDYQTVYAQVPGAVAAPTAGLHFTDELFETLTAKGIDHAYVTLHVGAGTFLPVKVDDVKDHVMHAEYGEVSQEVADKVNAVKKQGGRIVAVGTTSVRLLESATDDDGILHPFAEETSIFITPGYRFKMVDVMMTNFHLPRSTLFMLVSAFTNLGCMQQAYAHAIEQGYRFYSYGDASLLFLQTTDLKTADLK